MGNLSKYFDHPDIIETVIEHYNAGICIVPPKQDGTKAPMVGWKQYTKERPDQKQLEAWYEPGRTGVDWICGIVSGQKGPTF